MRTQQRMRRSAWAGTLLALALAAPWVARAATVTWDGSTDLNWTAPDATSFSGSPYSNGDDVLFTGLGPGTVTVTAGGVAPNSLTFSNASGANYTFAGGPITGGTGLVKTGTGNVTLGVANTYTGATTVSAGALITSVNTALPSTTALTITSPGIVQTKNGQVLGSLAGSGTLQGLDGNGNITIGSDNTSTIFSGTTTGFGGGSGFFRKIGTGTLTITSAANPAVGTQLQGGGITLSGAGTLTGGSMTQSHGTVLTLDNSGTNNTDRIGNYYPYGGELIFIGNAAAAASEGANDMRFYAGDSKITILPNAAQSATVDQAHNGSEFLVYGGASVLIRGPSLGSAPAAGVAVFRAWDFDVPGRLQGGAGGAGTTTVKIFPHLVGDTTGTGDGSGFMTFSTASSPYTARLLNPATEYAGTITSGSAVLDNVRLTSAVTGISAATTINCLLLESGGSVAGSGTLNLNTNDVLANGTGTAISVATLAFGAGEGYVRVTSGSDLTISSQITGSSAVTYGLTKGGNGNLILSGAGNSYTKATQINAGTLTVTADGALGATGSGNGTVVMSGATLALDGGVNYATAEAVTLNGTGAGGAGALNNASGANTFGGQVTLASDSAIGAAAGTLTLTAPVLGNYNVSKVGTGTLRLNAPITTTATTAVNQGTVLAGAADVLLLGPVSIAAAGTLDANGHAQHLYSLAGAAGATVSLGGATLTTGQGNTSTTFAGGIAGAGASGLTKIGTGTLTLTGANGYAGATTVDAGALALGGAAGALTGSSGVTVNAGGTLTLDNTAGNANRLADSAALTLAGGALNLLGNPGAATGETVGNVTWGGTGGAVATLTPGAGQSAVLTGAALTVADRGTTLVRGTALGSALGANVAQVKFTGTVPLTGGGGAAGSTTISTIPHTVGDTSAAGVGTDWVTYDATNGVRLLTGAEYAATITAGSTVLDNVSLTAAVSGINSPTTINSLRLQSGGSVAGTGTLTVASGDIMAAAAGTTLSTTTLAFGAAQGTFYTPAATDTVTVTGTITGTGGIAKGGAGTANLNITGTLPAGPVTIGGGELNLSAAVSKLPVLGALYVAPGATLRYNNSERVGSLAGGGTLIGTAGNNVFRFGWDNTDTTFWGSFNQAGGSPGVPGIEKSGTGTTTIVQSMGTMGSFLGVADGTLRFYGNGHVGTAGSTTVYAGARVIVDDTLTHVDNRTRGTTVAGEYIVLGSNSANSAVGGPNNTGFYFGTGGLLGNPTLTLVPGAGFEAQYRQRNGGDAGTFGVGTGVVALVRGDNLGQTTGTRSRLTIRDINLYTYMIGGAGQKLPTWSGGGQGTPQVSVLYRAYGDDSSAGMGEGFVTYQPTGSAGNSGDQVPETDPGVRLLSASEYATTIADGDGAVLSTIANTKLTSAVTGINSATQVNSLLLEQGGSVAGTGTLTVYSGLIMSTGTAGAITTAGLAVPAISSNSQISLITPASDDRLSISSTITGSGGLVKVGEGTVVLTGSNGYSGTTYIASGALRAASGTGLPAGSNLCFTGGVLEGSGTFSRALGTGVTNVQWDAYCSGGFAANGGAFNIQLNGGTGSVTWDNTASFVQGHRDLLLGSVTADNVVDFQNALNLGSFDVASGDRTDSTARTVQVIDNPGSAADKARISGVISGPATLLFRKTGNGTLELTNANTYSGGTAVEQGTLLVSNTSGSGTGSGAVTVSAGARLGGTGSMAGPVSVMGATAAPGASIGTLTATGNVSFAGTGNVLEIEFDTTSMDQLVVGGTLDLGTDTALLVIPLYGTYIPPEGKLFTLAQYGTLNGTFSQLLIPTNFEYAINYAAGNAISLFLIPEPGTALLLAGLAAAGLAARRRR